MKKRLKSLFLVAVTVVASGTLSNAVCAQLTEWEEIDYENYNERCVKVHTYDPDMNVNYSKYGAKVLLTEDMRNNISQYLGVDRTKFQNLQYLDLEVRACLGSKEGEMLLRPQWTFLNQCPEVYDERCPRPPIGQQVTSLTPHNDFSLNAIVDVDARVFNGSNQISNLVRYDRNDVIWHTLLKVDEHGSTYWANCISPPNLGLGFNNEGQSRAVLSFVDFNGGPVGTLNGAAIGLTPVSNRLTLNVLVSDAIKDNIDNSIIPSLQPGLSSQEKWKQVFLNLFRHGLISVEVMHHLLGFELADLNEAIPLAIVPAPLRAAAIQQPDPLPPTQTFVSPPTASTVSTPPRSALSPTFSVSSGVPEEATVEVFRVYNPNDGKHHYTMNKGEVAVLVAAGWRDEGSAFRCSVDGMPVYRLYNPNNGIHHFTINANEKDALVAAGWQDEGIAWYARTAGTVPVYRIYNPGNGEHVWTTNHAEVENAVAHGWNDEGIAWFIV